MAQRNEIYRCELCGTIVVVLHGSDGELVCCGREMVLLKENSVEAAQEKHVPVIEHKGSTYTVQVGSVAHPMEEKHYIEFIELVTEARVYRAFLDPGKKPWPNLMFMARFSERGHTAMFMVCGRAPGSRVFLSSTQSSIIQKLPMEGP